MDESESPVFQYSSGMAFAVLVGLAGAAAGLLALVLNAQVRGWLHSADGGWIAWRLALAGLVVLLFLVGALAIGRASRWRPPLLEAEPNRGRTESLRPKPWGARTWTWGALLFVLGLGIAVYLGQLRVGSALAMALLGTLTLLFALLFLRAVERGEPPLFESHWGGLGGGLGGWRISPALAYLVATLLFGALVAGLTFQQIPGDGEEATAREEQGEQGPSGSVDGTTSDADGEEEPSREPDEPEAPTTPNDATGAAEPPGDEEG